MSDSAISWTGSHLWISCSPPRSSVHGDSPGKNTGVGCHFLLQGIFPTQGLIPSLLMSPALAGGFFTTSATWEAHYWPIKGEQRPPGKQRHPYQARYLRSDCLEGGGTKARLNSLTHTGRAGGNEIKCCSVGLQILLS